MLKSIKGFTFLEIIIVIGIMVFLFSLGLIASIGFYRQEVLGAERDMVVAILKHARSEAQNNINQSAHGVYFGSAANYTVFQGDDYASRNPAYDEIFSRTSGLDLGGPAEFVFLSLAAGSNVSGTISISNGVQTSTISVNYEGMIDW